MVTTRPRPALYDHRAGEREGYREAQDGDDPESRRHDQGDYREHEGDHPVAQQVAPALSEPLLAPAALDAAGPADLATAGGVRFRRTPLLSRGPGGRGPRRSIGGIRAHLTRQS